ncbi:MAG: Ig-like domain-containing protein [Butyrivibrio sp.]|nr:Ig-like domain-containing protein [Butyrivibrio sp.]
MKKRILCFFMLLILVFGLTACQKNNKIGITENVGSDVHELNKDEFVGMLGDTFGYLESESEEAYFEDVTSANEYYDRIQACAEWEVIDAEKSFKPADKATWRYAVESCVRAIGLEDIKDGKNTGTLTDDLVAYFNENIASFDTSGLDKAIDSANARIVLDCAKQYADELELEQKFESKYNEGVVEAKEGEIQLKGDGKSAFVLGDAKYKAGDIIYLPPTKTSAAQAIRVESAEDNLIKYSAASVDDVYESLVVKGTYEGQVISAVGNSETEAAINVSSLDQIPGHTSDGSDFVPTKVTTSGNSVIYTADLGDGAVLTIAIKDISLKADVDLGFFKVNKANATLNFTDSINFDYKFNKTSSKSFNLGKMAVNIGPTPLAVVVTLDVTVGVNGEVTLDYSTDVCASIKYEKGKGVAPSITTSNENCDFHADVTAMAKPKLKIDLRALGQSIVNANVTTGIVAIAKIDADLLGNEPSCIDLFMYVPLSFGVNEDGCLVTAVCKKAKYRNDIWTSENSKIQIHKHWEDGTEVGECTRGEEKEVELDNVDEDGEPWEPEEFFEGFEEMDVQMLWLDAQILFLTKGESSSIAITEIPEGYSESDLVYKPDKSSVCTASGGSVTGVDEGSTTVEVSTKDGKYKAYFTVVVEYEYHDLSDFEELDFDFDF